MDTQRATVPQCELYYLGQSKSNRTSCSWIEWFIQAMAADCCDNRLPPGKVPLQQTKLSGTHKPPDSWRSVWIKFWRFNYMLIIKVYISDHHWEDWPLINSQLSFFNNCPTIIYLAFHWIQFHWMWNNFLHFILNAVALDYKKINKMQELFSELFFYLFIFNQLILKLSWQRTVTE